MEQDHLHSIASSLFDAMDDSTWKVQSLDAIEGAVQRLFAQLGTTLLEEFLLPKRIANYEAVKAAGGCVNSGLTEKANDLLVCRQLKEGTMHWTRAGAAPVLQRRQHFINQYASKRTGAYEVAFCHHFFQ